VRERERLLVFLFFASSSLSFTCFFLVSRV